MRIVISYAREDRAVVHELAETLASFGHQPWTDAGAHSGARWWDEIVQRIQQCDVLLAVTSPASLTSRACTLERQYALALNKVLLPVRVAPVNLQGLPSEFAEIHFFDYTVRDAAAAGRLFQALRQLPAPGPLPRPLPAPPPPPLSYLNDIADQLATLPPDVDRQERIVTALINGLRAQDTEERTTAAELMRRYLEHPHRLPDPAQRAGEAFGRTMTAAPPPPVYAMPQMPQQGPPPVRRSKTTTVLAWIGGLTIVLIAIAIFSAANEGTDTPGVYPAELVSRNVYGDLVSKGVQPASVNCGSLVAQIGSTTYCATTGLPAPGVTIRLVAVQGNTFTWEYLTG
jgi:hypothetical protein